MYLYLPTYLTLDSLVHCTSKLELIKHASFEPGLVNGSYHGAMVARLISLQTVRPGELENHRQVRVPLTAGN